MSLRLIIAILGIYGCALIFVHRAGLSVAIVAMVKPTNVTHEQSSINCITDDHNSTETEGSGDYDWSESLQGLILGAVYYGYLVFPIISGRITEKFGSKWLTAVAVFTPAILSALTPIAADYNVGLVIAIRVLMGACHACIYPSLFSLFAHWFPSDERAIAVSALAFGGNLGSAIAFPVAGYLCEYGFAGGWASVFYVTALAHLPWLLAWIYFVDDSPAASARISDKELQFIKSCIDSSEAPQRTSKAPWNQIVKSRAVWAAITTKIASYWGMFLLMSKMPSYLDSVFGIPLVHNGLFNSLSQVAICVTMVICGPLSTYIINNTTLTKTRVRKLFEEASLLGSALCIGLVPAMGCDSTAVIALLIVSMLAYGCTTGGEWPIVAEFAPDFSGTVFGISNVFGMCTAIIAPYIVGVLLDASESGSRTQWNVVFYITVALYVVGVVVFELCASAEPQHWAIVDKTKTDTHVKPINDNLVEIHITKA